MVPFYGALLCTQYDNEIDDTSYWNSKPSLDDLTSFLIFIFPSNAFPDMINHDNAKYNVNHKYDPYSKSQKEMNLDSEKGQEIFTTKAIHAGDQLYNSYNRCNICDEYFDWVGTPEMFLMFGFVESMPQRWLFDFARVKFDLDWKDDNEETGEQVVNFLVPPSLRGMRFLQEETIRLMSFSSKHRSNSHEEYEGMSKYEWDSLWQYYDALHNALSQALESHAPLSDDVWKLDDDWWVQDGTMVAENIEEHYVLPTQRDMVTNDEL